MAKQGRYLNDDVFFDVLSRLPAKTLVGLKLVSKGWLGLISDLCFVRAQLQKTKLTLSGFVFQQKYQWSDEDIKTASYISLGSGKNDSFRVNHAMFDFLPDDVVVLASCNGLVCCRSCFPTQDPAVYICNPVNKQWLTLKWVGLDQGSNIALASDSGQDFKLVTVKKLETEGDEEEEEMFRFGFEVYCSRTRVWTRAKQVCESRAGLSENASVHVNGSVHWLTRGDEILTFEVETEIPWLISVPVPASELDAIPRSCIGESKGKLHYAMVSDRGLSLWHLEGRAGSEWVLGHWISLETMEREHPMFFFNLSERVSEEARAMVVGTPWVNPLAFEGDSLLVRVSAKLYLYSFDGGEMREVCDASELGSCSMFFPTVVPYSMSLVPLLSRP